MLIATLQHIPTWVFLIFFGLIALGVSQSFARSVTLRRSTVLPLALVGLSLAGVLGGFGGQPLALFAWALGLAGAVASLHGRVDTSRVQFSPVHQRFQIPGSWVPLAIMMALFMVKFGVGFTLASHPDLHRSLPFALVASASYGVFSGIFLGRAMALWKLARQATPQPA